MNDFDEKYRARFEKLSTTNMSDAMDALGIKGSTYGIRPMRESWGKVVGRAVTVKMIAAGEYKSGHHLGMTAISAASAGDIVMGDRSGVVVLPYNRAEEVLTKAEALYEKEEAMVREILAGGDVLGVDSKFGYEQMLK